MNYRLLSVSLLLVTGGYVGTPVAEEVPPSPTPVETPITLTLADCIHRGLANSPGLEAAEFDREAVEGKLKEAKASYILPELKLRVLGGPVPDVPNGTGPEANFPAVNNSFWDLGPFIQVRVEAIQPLFTFGKISNLKDAASSGVKAKKEQEAVVRHDLVRKIKGVYFGLAYLYSLQDFLLELQDRSSKARERVEDQLRHRSAEVTNIDLMRIDVFAGETNRRLIELRSGIEMGLKAIQILTGLPSKPPVDIADKMVRFKNIDLAPVDFYLDRARISRPEVAQLADAVAIKKSMLKASKANFFPSFFVGGFYGYGKAPDREHVDNPFLNDTFNYSSGGVALGLEQKLGFHITNAQYEQTVAEYHQALAQQRLAMQGIELQIRQAYSDVISKRDAVKTGEASFKAGRSWVMASSLNFGVGLTPVKDLLESFVAYSRVKVGYFDIIHDYQEALAELSHVVGEEVTDLAY